MSAAAPYAVPDAQALAGLLVTAANALVLPAPPDEERYAPIGIRCVKGRVALGRRRALLGSGDVKVLTQFGGVCWLGREKDAPDLNGTVLPSLARWDKRGRLLLDSLSRIYLAVPDHNAFDVALLDGPDHAGMYLVPLYEFSRRIEGVGDATV